MIKVEQPRTQAAIWKHQNAAEHRALASHLKEITEDDSKGEADRLDAEAEMLLHVHEDAIPSLIGPGGEVETGRRVESSRLIDTLTEGPDMVAVDASRHRLGLAAGTGAMALALDAANTVQAKNSLEKMIIQQTSAAHVAAMELQAEARALLGRLAEGDRCFVDLATAATRLMSTSARMMEVSQRGMMALHRLRSSGRQPLVVQHVNVSEGGQAIFAGEMRDGIKRRRAARNGRTIF